MTDIKDILKQEVDKLLATVNNDISDPAHRVAVARMTMDLASLPIRMAAGEDVSLLMDSLKAEAALRGQAMAMRAQMAAQQAWMNIVIGLVTKALL